MPVIQFHDPKEPYLIYATASVDGEVLFWDDYTITFNDISLGKIHNPEKDINPEKWVEKFVALISAGPAILTSCLSKEDLKKIDEGVFERIHFHKIHKMETVISGVSV